MDKEKLSILFLEFIEEKINQGEFDLFYQSTIPLSLFQYRTIGPMESIVKFLKENMDKSLSEISRLLNNEIPLSSDE